ncbi:MAG TPA: protein kinase [Pyrinomonadaceae bacterium]|nr:protein kinase [Pyrinomonadaceae bacterium]
MLDKGDKFGKYTIVRRIGLDEQGNSKGANATVFVVSYKDKEYVLKIPNNPERLENHFREIGNWAKVSKHPNILTYYETVTHSGKIGFVSEYIQTGSLNDWLKNSANLTLSQKLSMIDGILNGLEHLHENLIFHRDLKPENIFVKNDVPLLADFGSAKDYDFAEMQYAYGFTYKYAPPELIALYDDFGVAAKYQITEFDDLWSAAIIICEILTCQYPFAGMSKILKAELSPFPKDTDRNIIGFLQKALQKERGSRFQSVKKMREALANPQQFIGEKIEDATTIIDQDFDETQKLKIVFTQDWQEKERQRKIAEAKRTREIKMQEIEAERQKNVKAGLLALGLPPNYFHSKADDSKADDYYTIAKDCRSKKDYDGAIKNYTKAIELNPDNALAYLWRGASYADKNNKDQAVKDFNKANALMPNSLFLRMFHTFLYSDTGEEI